mmetsp:Transcript_93638/g.180684  ORF Transcript_93638/g.180684 Transcript_93638/m.180684 type:complete len:476 (-) Transcript_93638:150-1577(-)
MARHVLEAAMAPTSRSTTVAQVTQEVRLFRVFHRRRSYHHIKVLAETRQAGSLVEEADDELLFLEDRDDFTRQQLLHRAVASSQIMGAMLSMQDVGLSRELSLRHSLDEQRQHRENAEALLRRLHELRGELACSQEQTAVAAARIRMLRALCTLGGGPDAELLSDKLAGMEVSLIGNGCSDSGSTFSTAALAAEFETVSPLATVLPLVRDLRTKHSTAREALEQSVADGRVPRRFLLPPQPPQTRSAASNHNSTAGKAEEEGLQRLLEELTEQQRTLRGQLQEVQEGRGSQRRDGQAREETSKQCWMSVAQLRLELASCYDKLAESNMTALDAEVAELQKHLQVAEDVQDQLRDESSQRGASDTCGDESVSVPGHRFRHLKGEMRLSSSASKLPEASSSCEARLTPTLSRFRTGELAALERHGTAVLKRLHVTGPGGPATGMVERKQQASGVKLRSPTTPLSRQKLVVGSSGGTG